MMPDFILPQTSVINPPRNDCQALAAPVEITRTIRDFWLKLPLVWVRTIICAVAIILGIMAGLITPWLAESLDRFMAIVMLVTFGASFDRIISGF